MRVLLSTFIQEAFALPPDEIEDQDLTPAYEDEPVALPASIDDPPCGDTDELDVNVEVTVASTGPFLSFPYRDGITAWRVQATLYFGPYRQRWTVDVPSESSLQLAMPPQALVDGYQTAWLSRVQLKAYALDVGGQTRGVRRLPTVWAVWDAGTDRAPRWLDDATKQQQAHTGAWADRALYVDSPALLEIEPPTGGAL